MRTYLEAEQYILNIPKFAGKHILEDTKKLLKQVIGNDIGSKIIHIAGTNGKGSVCAYLRAILMEAGCSVGMFTSPHLETMRERICIGNEMISEEDFVRIFEKVREVLDEKNHPSFFEYLFLMGMIYFKEKGPEYIILETGMGGRLDATNCIGQPLVCIITEIGYDHMQHLGDTISKIAGEKAGIIKAGVPVVFLDKRAESTKVLTEYAGKVQSPAVIVKNDNILDVNINKKSIDFSLHTSYYNYVGLTLKTVALYQVENASLAVVASELIGNPRITPDVIRKGLQAMYWPGRMEEVFPGIYLDGAHNEDGIDAFLDTVERDCCSGERLLLFGVAEDKCYDRMIQKIAGTGLFGKVAVTTLESDRSAGMKELKMAWRPYGQITSSFYDNVGEAYRYLLSVKKETDVIYIVGSLYLAGQMKSLMRSAKYD